MREPMKTGWILWFWTYDIDSANNYKHITALRCNKKYKGLPGKVWKEYTLYCFILITFNLKAFILAHMIFVCQRFALLYICVRYFNMALLTIQNGSSTISQRNKDSPISDNSNVRIVFTTKLLYWPIWYTLTHGLCLLPCHFTISDHQAYIFITMVAFSWYFSEPYRDFLN